MRYGQDRQTLYTAIGERIMLARRRAGVSQRELGRRLGVSHAAVSDIERAATRPNLDNLEHVAHAIGVPLYQIVTMDDLSRRQPPRADAAGGGEE